MGLGPTHPSVRGESGAYPTVHLLSFNCLFAATFSRLSCYYFSVPFRRLAVITYSRFLPSRDLAVSYMVSEEKIND